MIRTINNAMRSLLFQAHLPSYIWVEALHTAVHIINLLPSKAIHNKVRFSVLFKKHVSYSHLKTFGCLCYPNINHSHLKKLSPRSSKCLFLGYLNNHKGYICLDLSTKKIIISRHMNFDESQYPYKDSTPSKESGYDFLTPETEPSILLRTS